MHRIIALMALLLAMEAPAFAYVGPGSGLAFLGSLVALLGAIGVAIVGFVWYPVKRLMRRRRERDEDEDLDADGELEEDVDRA